MDRMLNAKDGWSNSLVTYTYDEVGNLAIVTSPNGVATTYTYDSLNRLTNVSTVKGSTAVASYAYTLGPAGNRTSVTELNGRTATYGYDDLYRLTSETIAGASAQNGTIAYEYDAVGNRKSLTSTVPAIPSGMMYYDANDRISTDQYDNNGNTVSSGGVSNVYDFENRLIQHGGITYGYDGDGNRVTKTVAGVTTKYIVTDANPTGYAQVLEEWTGSNYIPYTFGLTLLAQFNSSNPSKQKFYGYDGHGSVRYLTNSSGTVTDTYDYDAFGNMLSRTGNTYNNYLFAGEQFDPDLGLYYNRARYLDVRTGRFWGMDTWEGRTDDPTTLHRFQYTGANPVNRIDPSGHFDLLELGIAITIGMTILTMSSCTRPKSLPISVGVVFEFDPSFTFLGNPLSNPEQDSIKATALNAMTEAYTGYGVYFGEGPKIRTITVRGKSDPGYPGFTPQSSYSSDVYLVDLYYTLLNVIGSDAEVAKHSREKLITALGFGIGATGAHELGHQKDLGFVLDSNLGGNYYDDGSANSSAHFFGHLKWSPESEKKMKQVLPRSAQ